MNSDRNDRIVVFPITIKKDKESKDYPYFVEIPDLDGMTEGKTIPDAIEMAKDYIGTYSLESELPESNTTLPKVNKDEITTLVTVNISAYKRMNDNRVVRKNVTIPNYLNELGKKANLNFSMLLSDAIKDKLGIE